MTYTVGVIGGGQLARMMIAPAIELGIGIRVLAEEAGMAAEPAVAAVGDIRDAGLVLDFARGVDVVTFDHEHVAPEVLAALIDAGVAVRPGPEALHFAQDKLAMRRRLAELGLPQPDWTAASTADDLQAFLDDHGGRAVVKTPRGGYDGKGVRVVTSPADAEDWLAGGAPLLVEELVDFDRELAQQVARTPSGRMRTYPLVETVQRGGVCAEVLAPAPRAGARLEGEAERIGTAIAEALGVTGMLAVELFEQGDRVLVNELAMRPHNSGHWSMDAAVTGQFEQHLRAVLDLPLGDPSPRQEWAVMVNLLGGPVEGGMADRLPAALADGPDVKVHLYGKAPRPGRKVGHVTAVGDDLDDAVARARAVAACFD